jgi:hypothetical protein
MVFLGLKMSFQVCSWSTCYLEVTEIGFRSGADISLRKTWTVYDDCIFVLGIQNTLDEPKKVLCLQFVLDQLSIPLGKSLTTLQLVDRNLEDWHWNDEDLSPHQIEPAFQAGGRNIDFDALNTLELRRCRDINLMKWLEGWAETRGDHVNLKTFIYVMHEKQVWEAVTPEDVPPGSYIYYDKCDLVLWVVSALMWNGGSGNLERIGTQFPSNITADDSTSIRVPLRKNRYFYKEGNSSMEEFVYLCGDETLAQHEIQKVVEFLPNLRHPQGMGDEESWHRL